MCRFHESRSHEQALTYHELVLTRGEGVDENVRWLTPDSLAVLEAAGWAVYSAI